MSYRFIFEKTPEPNNEFDFSTITMELGNRDLSLDKVLLAFSEYLAACGFAVEIGSIVHDKD